MQNQFAIAQGIAQHITQNVEKLRQKFVDFDGKKEIIVEDNSLKIDSNKNDWSFVLKQFDEGCRKLTNNDIVDLMTCNFNSTSVTSQTASKCVLFKAMSEYIDFSTMTMSGIPEIILVGSVQDWKKVQTKCKKLKEMKIGFINNIKPINFFQMYSFNITLFITRNTNIKFQIIFIQNTINILIQ